jgi:hypothetical protein
LLLVTESLTLIAGNSSVRSSRHLVEAVDAGGGLLADALMFVGDAGPLAGVVLKIGLRISGSGRFELLGSSAGSGCAGRRRPSRTRRPCGPAAWRRRRRRRSGSGRSSRRARSAPARCTTSTPPASRPSTRRRDALRVVRCAVGPTDDRRGGVILGREDVARRPADVGAELDQRLDQHRGLHGHVQRAGDPSPERLASPRTWRGRPSGPASRARPVRSPCASG